MNTLLNEQLLTKMTILTTKQESFVILYDPLFARSL